MDFVKSEMPSARRGCWVPPQSRAEMDQAPSITSGLLRWRLQSCRKHENCTDSQQLGIQSWILNEYFSIHPRSGSRSVAAAGNLCAQHRDSYWHGATTPSPAAGHSEKLCGPWVSPFSVFLPLITDNIDLHHWTEVLYAKTDSSTHSCSQNTNTCKMWAQLVCARLCALREAANTNWFWSESASWFRAHF